MSVIRVNWSSSEQSGEAFCDKCNRSIGVLSWDEMTHLSRSLGGAICFDCEKDKACDLYPVALVMGLEDAWRLVVDDMVFYGEWANCGSFGGVEDGRFLVPWVEMQRREIEKDGEFIELPKSWFEGESGPVLPCLVCANLKHGEGLGDYCEA